MLREGALRRDSNWADLTKRREDQAHQIAMEKIKLKQLDSKLQHDKAAGAIAKADAAKAKISIDNQKLNLKLDAQKTLKMNKLKCKKLAHHVHAECVKVRNAGGKDMHQKLLDHSKKIAVSGKYAHARSCPTFFDAEIDCLMDVTCIRAGDGAKKGKGASTYCSDDLARKLFKGHQSKSNNKDPRNALRELLSDTLPGYHGVMPSEYHADALLAKHRKIVDLCFLEAAWRYAKFMGNKFPLSLDFSLPSSLCIAVPASAASSVGAASSSTAPAASGGPAASGAASSATASA
jgi:hypothetical protein